MVGDFVDFIWVEIFELKLTGVVIYVMNMYK